MTTPASSLSRGFLGILADLVTYLANTAVLFKAGTVAAPGIAIGAINDGLWWIAAKKLGFALGGAEGFRMDATGTVPSFGGGDTPPIAGSIYVLGSAGYSYLRQVGMLASRFTADAQSGAMSFIKGRGGSPLTPAAPATSDNVVTITGFISDGTGTYPALTLVTAGTVSISLNAASPSASDAETSFTVSLPPAASVTQTELLKARHASGLLMYTSVVIDQNRHLRKRSYTVATLPTNPAAGSEAYCSNETGGATGVEGDGTNWRRWSDRAVAA